ncbi:MAG: hypothetical protein H0W72_02110 [Planctomycetes bacterium]|nr:hypothetical protein [Planctomycetota bacterium]
MSDDGAALGAWAKTVLVVSMLFLFSLFKSCQEVKYMVFGTNVSADVLDATESTSMGRRGRRNPVIDVGYVFTTKDGQVVSRREQLSPSAWTAPADGKVAVSYYGSGEDVTATLRSRRSKIWLLLFVGITAGLAFAIHRMIQPADWEKAQRHRRAG